MTRSLVVVDSLKGWEPLAEAVELVEARAYLAQIHFEDRVTVYNFCRSYKYQTEGYYVSLLASARRHRPVPKVDVMGDLRFGPMLRLASEQLAPTLESSLGSPAEDTRITLRVVFGSSLEAAHQKLAKTLFSLYPIPLMQARLRYQKQEWLLESVRPLARGELSDEEFAYLLEQAEQFFRSPRRPRRRKDQGIYSLAILVNPSEPEPPSDDKALSRFQKAARERNLNPVLIEPSDFGHLAEFDALFIRETTGVNHHTYRFARKAEAEGMVVLDDPESIVRCCSKAFQAQLFATHNLPCPKTELVSSRTDLDALELSYPCVAKVPDSSFSHGVTRAQNRAELVRALEEIFQTSELAVIQSYTPSRYDWRIGVLEGEALYACRYEMAAGHWQIYKDGKDGTRVPGKVRTVSLEEVPKPVLSLAVKASRLIGQGLYGVDLKEIDGKPLLIEVNDNPSIEAGDEDRFLKGELYGKIMDYFWNHLEKRREGRK